MGFKSLISFCRDYWYFIELKKKVRCPYLGFKLCDKNNLQDYVVLIKHSIKIEYIHFLVFCCSSLFTDLQFPVSELFEENL